MGASKVLIVGGLILIIAGMLLGDVFAMFIGSQNNSRIGELLFAATDAVAAKDPAAVAAHFKDIGSLLENHGTKVDTHVHAIDFGCLALLLALIQPYVAFGRRERKRLAILFIIGAVMLPVSVFLIHYVGLAYSPFKAIGWASIFADLGGSMVIVACVGVLIGIWRYLRSPRESVKANTSAADLGWASRILLVGGTFLILAGFVHGAYYAMVDLQAHESQDQVALETMVNAAAAKQDAAVQFMHEAYSVVEGYGEIRAEKAIKISAHSHIIEFGLLAILLALIQRYVALPETLKLRWALVMLAGSILMPFFMLQRLELGALAKRIADMGGLLVTIATAVMLVGVLRYSGRVRTKQGMKR